MTPTTDTGPSGKYAVVIIGNHEEGLAIELRSLAMCLATINTWINVKGKRTKRGGRVGEELRLSTTDIMRSSSRKL